MLKKKLYFTIIIFSFGVVPILAQASFNKSLHFTREGKRHWYSTTAHNGTGGFETLTNVPIENLGCQGCHPADNLDANGNPSPTPFTPTCLDCHETNKPASNGSPGKVSESSCLGCHGREGFIKGSSTITDVHDQFGFKCWTCHPTSDFHGNGSAPQALMEKGAISASCTQSGCHTVLPASHSSNDPHNGKLSCKSCHMSTELACYNCHFESITDHHIKRAKMKITGFIILVNGTVTGKIEPATFQSLSYKGKTWVAIAPAYTHTITRTNARKCADCHTNMGGTIQAIDEYNSTGKIKFATWNSGDSTLTWKHGIVPLPVDYLQSFRMDFITFNGDPTTAPGTDNKNWSFVKNTWDGIQFFYGTPLNRNQMAALGMDTTKIVTGVEDVLNIPTDYKLEQNYPNPFNPSTKIQYTLPKNTFVKIIIYDVLGNVVETLVNKEQSLGEHTVNFNANNIASGIYFYQLKTNAKIITRKMVLMK